MVSRISSYLPQNISEPYSEYPHTTHDPDWPCNKAGCYPDKPSQDPGVPIFEAPAEPSRFSTPNVVPAVLEYLRPHPQPDQSIDS